MSLYRRYMSQLKLFIPMLLGIVIVLFSYYLGSILDSIIESNKYVASQISTVLQQQEVEEKTGYIINDSVNSLLEINHSLLLHALNFIRAIGFALTLWFFPYHAISLFIEKKI